MTNPTTVDRNDVAHPTDPIGGATQIEQSDNAQPPARTGKASRPEQPVESHAGRADPTSRVPEPVKQDLGFARGFDKEDR